MFRGNMKIILSNRKAIFVIGCGVALLWLFLFMPEKALSQEDSTVQRKLVVGTVAAPPLSMKATNGQ
jgi:hypothetical protein